MVYATETVLALHRARIADERRNQARRRSQRIRAVDAPVKQPVLRPASVTR